MYFSSMILLCLVLVWALLCQMDQVEGVGMIIVGPPGAPGVVYQLRGSCKQGVFCAAFLSWQSGTLVKPKTMSFCRIPRGPGAGFYAIQTSQFFTYSYQGGSGYKMSGNKNNWEEVLAFASFDDGLMRVKQGSNGGWVELRACYQTNIGVVLTVGDVGLNCMPVTEIYEDGPLDNCT
jgi:hypothetical protein